MLQVINGPTIQVGESLSDVIDCSAGQLVRITMPAEWTYAELTFQFSSDGEFFNEMYGLDGYAVTIKTVVPGSGVVIPGDVGRAISFMRFRSGTEGNPVPQEATRAFALAIRTDGAAPAAKKTSKKTTKKKPAKKKPARR
jgi:hypothetical protein